jgi:demethylmenaquinone methyltransferase / 2-methoxy-6-polyprenyl-1,4-benzoquinol methylase
VMPVVVNTSSSNPEAYSYLLDSIQEWPDQETLAQWIRGVGFTRVAYRNLTVGIVALHRGRKPQRKTRKPKRATAGIITPVTPEVTPEVPLVEPEAPKP